MTAINQKYALILVEGDTEVLFYGRLKDSFYRTASSKTLNLTGNWNINQKVLDRVSRHAEDHPRTMFSVFVCIDRESRSGLAPIDMDLIRSELSDFGNVDQNNIRLFEAVQDIECLFFYDIDGIYRFLRTPTAQRNPRKYRPVEKLCHIDLSTLFKQVNKEYRKGNASQNFINSLDINLIKSSSPVLGQLCTLMGNY